MKYTGLVLTLIVASVTNLAQATTSPTPVSHIPQTPTQKTHARISHQMIQIQKETKRGKLTKAQEKTLVTQLEAVRKQEKTFLKQNGNKTLTDAQIAQLTQQINALSKTIPIK